MWTSGQSPIRTAEEWESDGRQQAHELRGNYGKALLWILVAQLIVADGVMIWYAFDGVHWKIPNSVMSTWLGATVVQVVGLVYVVVSHLFPKNPE